MASIEQAKDALEQQREAAALMTDKALNAIDAVVTLSAHTITAIGVIATMVALIGGVAIYVAAREMAKRVATRRIEAYLKGDEGKLIVQRAVEDEVRRQIQERYVLVVQPDKPPGPVTEFPIAPSGAGSAAS